VRDGQTARARRARRRFPTVVLLVRHGTTPTTGAVLPGRAGGLHLSDTGRAQAEATATRIAALVAGAGGKAATARGARPDRRSAAPVAVYASPLERARETAAPIARALGLRVRTERGLLECDFGEWTGAELKALMRLPEWATVQRAPSLFRFPGGESFVDMQRRVTDALARLVARHPGKTVVAVSHADPIKAALAMAAGTPLDLFQRLVVSPCSVSAVAYAEGGTHVLTVNSTGSLAELGLS
jgi:broad specificity phosphatase PhoE